MIIVIFYFFIRSYLKNRNEKSLIATDSSSNLFTIIPSKAERNKKNPILIFSAHYDSVISRYSYRFNIILNALVKVLLIPFFLFLIVLSILFIFIDFSIINFDISTLYNTFIFITSILAIFISPLYLFMYRKDAKISKGSIDNASGVSILIELAKYFRYHPLENYSILFLWFGAEEWGLKGSESFYKKYIPYFKQEYDLKKSVNINIDMVGTHLGLLNNITNIRNNSKKINKKINLSAQILNIPIYNFSRIINPKSDHKSFKKYCRKNGEKDFQVACFHSINDRKYIHTVNDTPDKCSTKNLFNCFKICILTSYLLDSSLNNDCAYFIK